MDKTAGWTVVQKTIINTLHKEGQTLKVIGNEAGSSQTGVSTHMSEKVMEGKDVT